MDGVTEELGVTVLEGVLEVVAERVTVTLAVLVGVGLGVTEGKATFVDCE